MIFSWENDAEGLLTAIFEKDSVRDDFAVEVNVSFSEGGDVCEFHAGRMHVK